MTRISVGLAMRSEVDNLNYDVSDRPRTSPPRQTRSAERHRCRTAVYEVCDPQQPETDDGCPQGSQRLCQIERAAARRAAVRDRCSDVKQLDGPEPEANNWG